MSDQKPDKPSFIDAVSQMLGRLRAPKKIGEEIADTPEDIAAMAKIRAEFAAISRAERPVETVLFLALNNKAPTKEDGLRSRAIVATDIEAYPATLEKDQATVQMAAVRIHVLFTELAEQDPAAFMAVKPGQWIECDGHFGGPLLDDFIPSTVRIRTEYGTVARRHLPKDDQIIGTLDAAMDYDTVPTATFQIKAM